MAKSRALARYLFRLKHQKRYSFTKTKMMIGFVVSLFTSIYFGTYFEQHGLEVVRQAYQAVTTGISRDSAVESSPRSASSAPKSDSQLPSNLPAPTNIQP